VNPLRILYHHRIRADDGQAVHVREAIGALRAAGHQVFECALVPKAVADVVAAGAARAPRGGVWQRLHLPRTAIEILEVLYDHRGRAMLRAAARDFRPHLLYERHALHCRAGLSVARELGIPLLLEVNAPMVDEMQGLGLLKFARRALATERAVLAGADAVLAVTRVLAELLVTRGARPETVHVHPNGARPERYDDTARRGAGAVRRQFGVPDDAFVVGFVGYVRDWHRLPLLLAAMTRPGLLAVHLLLVGRGPALPSLRQQAAQLGIGDRVHAAGEVPPELLPSHVSAFDACLIPAINAYASPLKLFDALAAGVPALAPDQPNLRELLVHGENGLLFTPGSVDALAAQLGALVADPQLARRLGAAGRRSLLQQRWTWDGNAARIAAVYAAVTQRGQVPA